MLDCKSFINEYKNAPKFDKEASNKECMDKAKQLLNPDGDKSVPPIMDILSGTNINDGLLNARIAVFNLARKSKMSEATQNIFQLNSEIVEQVIDDVTKSVDISYDIYNQIKEQLMVHNEYYGRILSPSMFALLPSAQPTDSNATLGVPASRKYIYKQDLIDSINHTIYSMQWYLEMKQGYAENDRFISYDGIQSFLQKHYKQFGQKFEGMYEDFYLQYCAQAIFFFMNARGYKISIEKLISSQYIEAALFFDGRPSSLYHKAYGPLYETGEHVFSRSVFMKIVQMYVDATSITPESRGFLNKRSMRAVPYYPSTHFIDCLFCATQLCEGCIDFRSFVDYILIVSFPYAPQAGYYSFKVLDAMNGAGYLNRQMILEAFDSVYADLKSIYGEIGIPKEDFVDEIFDCAKPADGINIYYRDIVRSNANDIFVRYLVSCQSLAERETMANNSIPVINVTPWKG